MASKARKDWWRRPKGKPAGKRKRKLTRQSFGAAACFKSR
jgi:hypothetical protein